MEETPIQSLYRLRVLGFAKSECKECLGRGRIGHKIEGDEVIPCECVAYFDLDEVREAQEKDALNLDVSYAATRQ